jgi:outer membrane protein OmpA-like peptidoglycan-associated protein
VFARASDRLLDQSRLTLDQVIDLMGRFPQSYLVVEGHARPEGDPEANRLLAERRAAAAADYIKAGGVPAHRVRATIGEADLTGGEAQSVTFVLKQMPF